MHHAQRVSAERQGIRNRNYDRRGLFQQFLPRFRLLDSQEKPGSDFRQIRKRLFILREPRSRTESARHPVEGGIGHGES